MLSDIKKVVCTKWKVFRLLPNFAAGGIYAFILSVFFNGLFKAKKTY
jgi:hypothetical protein